MEIWEAEAMSKDKAIKLFPVFESKGFDLREVPWGILEGHEGQALINHNQTLARLAERGGLSLVEMACILNNSTYDRKMSGVRAYEFILVHIKAWNRRSE